MRPMSSLHPADLWRFWPTILSDCIISLNDVFPLITVVVTYNHEWVMQPGLSPPTVTLSISWQWTHSVITVRAELLLTEDRNRTQLHSGPWEEVLSCKSPSVNRCSDPFTDSTSDIWLLQDLMRRHVSLVFKSSCGGRQSEVCSLDPRNKHLLYNCCLHHRTTVVYCSTCTVL